MDGFFLGPRSENETWARVEFEQVLGHWFNWRKGLFSQDGPFNRNHGTSEERIIAQYHKMSQTLKELLKRYESETPKFVPRYIGHMVSEISLPAFLGHIANLLHNPNLASKEVSRVAGEIEREAINSLLEMFGFNSREGYGHFTSGGTIANIEALWRARFRWDHWLSMGTWLRRNHFLEKTLFEVAHMGWKLYDQFVLDYKIEDEELKKFSSVINGSGGVSSLFKELWGQDYLEPVVLVPATKHYSWPKATSLLGFGDKSCWPIQLNSQGKLDLASLQEKIELARTQSRPVAMVVSVAGTTEMGEVDPVDGVQDLLDEYKKDGIYIWHHVDAAYGGFFACLEKGEGEVLLSNSVFSAFESIRRAESVTIDPHKLGYVPYACGAILCRDERAYQVSTFEAPYLMKDHRGVSWWSTLEGSRSGSGAAATWMTSKTLGFDNQGIGQVLRRGLAARKILEEILEEQPNIYVAKPIDTNVLCFCVAFEGESLSDTNSRNEKIFKKFCESPNFSISKTFLSQAAYGDYLKGFVSQWKGINDGEGVFLLRTVLMNPFYKDQCVVRELFSEFVHELQTYIK